MLEVFSGGGEVDASVDVVTVEGRRVTFTVTGSGQDVRAAGPDGLTAQVRVR